MTETGTGPPARARRMLRVLFPGVALVSLVVLLAACGNGDDNGDGADDANGDGSDEEYVQQVCDSITGFVEAQEELAMEADPADEEAMVEESMSLLEDFADELDDANPPADVDEAHNQMVEGMRDIIELVEDEGPEALMTAQLPPMELDDDVQDRLYGVAEGIPECQGVIDGFFGVPDMEPPPELDDGAPMDDAVDPDQGNGADEPADADQAADPEDEAYVQDVCQSVDAFLQDMNVVLTESEEDDFDDEELGEAWLVILADFTADLDDTSPPADAEEGHNAMVNELNAIVEEDEPGTVLDSPLPTMQLEPDVQERLYAAGAGIQECQGIIDGFFG